MNDEIDDLGDDINGPGPPPCALCLADRGVPCTDNNGLQMTEPHPMRGLSFAELRERGLDARPHVPAWEREKPPAPLGSARRLRLPARNEAADPSDPKVHLSPEQRLRILTHCYGVRLAQELSLHQKGDRAALIRDAYADLETISRAALYGVQKM